VVSDITVRLLELLFAVVGVVGVSKTTLDSLVVWGAAAVGQILIKMVKMALRTPEAAAAPAE
jgi:hypothetical protein